MHIPKVRFRLESCFVGFNFVLLSSQNVGRLTMSEAQFDVMQTKTQASCLDCHNHHLTTNRMCTLFGPPSAASASPPACPKTPYRSPAAVQWAGDNAAGPSFRATSPATFFMHATSVCRRRGFSRVASKTGSSRSSLSGTIPLRLPLKLLLESTLPLPLVPNELLYPLLNPGLGPQCSALALVNREPWRVGPESGGLNPVVDAFDPVSSVPDLVLGALNPMIGALDPALSVLIPAWGGDASAEEGTSGPQSNELLRLCGALRGCSQSARMLLLRLCGALIAPRVT